MRSAIRTAAFLIVGLFFSVPALAVEPVFSADGAAIHGYDPVAYFTESEPREGVAAYELSWAGATWRFSNEGNRDAFMQDPSVYEPRYGGYDPVAIGTGVPTPGHPGVWLVHNQRLYVFHSEANRALFMTSPAEAIQRAEGHWAQVKAQLVP